MSIIVSRIVGKTIYHSGNSTKIALMKILNLFTGDCNVKGRWDPIILNHYAQKTHYFVTKSNKKQY
jgi:hypothetical protein